MNVAQRMAKTWARGHDGVNVGTVTGSLREHDLCESHAWKDLSLVDAEVTAENNFLDARIKTPDFPSICLGKVQSL